jgi:hypothetical protein
MEDSMLLIRTVLISLAVVAIISPAGALPVSPSTVRSDISDQSPIFRVAKELDNGGTKPSPNNPSVTCPLKNCKGKPNAVQNRKNVKSKSGVMLNPQPEPPGKR